MSRHSKDLQQKRNADLVSEWNKLINEKDGEIPKFSHAYIIKLLQDKFYLGEQVIMKIIRNNT